MRTRAFLLVAVVGVALVVAACGRASQAEINQALGITPTATASAEQIAAATAAASAAAATRTAVVANAGSPGAGPAVAAVGDVTRGSTQFLVQCSGCHGPGGAGGNLREPGGPGAAVTADNLLVLIREGANHPPGPYTTAQLSDASVRDIATYIQAQAGTAP